MNILKTLNLKASLIALTLTTLSTVTPSTGTALAAETSVPIGGEWRDSNGDTLRLEMQRDLLTVKPLSENVRKWWDKAYGRVQQGRISSMTHTLNGRVTDRVIGRVSTNGARIDWSNGSFWTLNVRPLDGQWVDPSGTYLRMSVRGNKIAAHPLDPAFPWWDLGKGQVKDGLIGSMVHSKNGRTCDRVSGRVALDGKRIDWSNGTTWTYVAPQVAKGVPISGRWQDSNGDQLRVEVRGNQVSVTPLSSNVLKWWDTGFGLAKKSKIGPMTHSLKGRVTDRVNGDVALDGRRITWSNGTSWVRIADR